MTQHITIQIPGAELVGLAEDEAHWHAMRKAGIGGSDAAAIMGDSPFTTAREIWASKTGRTQPGEGNAYTEFGHLMERALLEARHPAAVLGDEVGSYRSLERAHMLGNFDGLEPDGTIIEIKTTEASKKHYWKARTPPRHYWCQVQHYLYVLGLERAQLTVCFVDGDRGTLVPLLKAQALSPRALLKALCTSRTYSIERDDKWLETYLSAADTFWERVQADTWDVKVRPF